MTNAPVNLDVISSAIHTIADAAEDTSNALGGGTTVGSKVGDFENLLPDLMNLAGNAPSVPLEAADLSAQAQQAVEQVAQSRFGVSGEQATDVVSGVMGILHDVQKFWPEVVHGIEGILKLKRK